jgi:hypothetical protein
MKAFIMLLFTAALALAQLESIPECAVSHPTQQFIERLKLKSYQQKCVLDSFKEASCITWDGVVDMTCACTSLSYLHESGVRYTGYSEAYYNCVFNSTSGCTHQDVKKTEDGLKSLCYHTEEYVCPPLSTSM